MLQSSAVWAQDWRNSEGGRSIWDWNGFWTQHEWSRHSCVHSFARAYTNAAQVVTNTEGMSPQPGVVFGEVNSLDRLHTEERSGMAHSSAWS